MKSYRSHSATTYRKKDVTAADILTALAEVRSQVTADPSQDPDQANT